MQDRDILSFLRRHRFKINDIADKNINFEETIRIKGFFPKSEVFSWVIKNDERRRLAIALVIGSYIYECSADDEDDYEIFSRLQTELSDEEWSYAIRFCPYHEVNEAIKNLYVIQSALSDTYVNLNFTFKSMEISTIGDSVRKGTFEIEREKATSHIINFITLYASYVDTCRKLRKLAVHSPSNVYDRALDRVLGSNRGMHRFVSKYRKFQLHYRVVMPNFQVRFGDRRESFLYLESKKILYSGFDWGVDARVFLENHPKIDVLDLFSSILGDVRRSVKFHQKMVECRLASKKRSYDSFIRARDRLKHLKKSASDIGALFKRPNKLINRLVDGEFVNMIIESDLSDEDAFYVLFKIADRHNNLNEGTLAALQAEIRNIIKLRPRYPVSKAYLGGRVFD